MLLVEYLLSISGSEIETIGFAHEYFHVVNDIIPICYIIVKGMSRLKHQSIKVEKKLNYSLISVGTKMWFGLKGGYKQLRF